MDGAAAQPAREDGEGFVVEVEEVGFAGLCSAAARSIERRTPVVSTSFHRIRKISGLVRGLLCDFVGELVRYLEEHLQGAGCCSPT